MTAYDALRAARNRIAHPSRWCRRALARNGFGLRVAPTSPSARSWCALGALEALAPCPHGTWTHVGLVCLLEAQSLARYELRAHEVNDGHEGHPRVLALFDEAIQELEPYREARL